MNYVNQAKGAQKELAGARTSTVSWGICPRLSNLSGRRLQKEIKL